MIRLLGSLWLGVVMFLVGCVSYQPQPLEPDIQWADLERIGLDDLAVNPDKPSSQSSDAGAVPAFDYADGLSADEAAGLATVLNPKLRAFRLNQQIAEGQLVTAGLLPNPEIDLRWLAVLGGGPTSGEINFLFDLTEALLTRKPRVQQAKIQVQQIRWEMADQEWQLVNQVRRVYVTLFYWDRALMLNHQQQRLLDRLLLITQAQRAAGAATDLDVVLAESEVAQTQRRTKRLLGQWRMALAQLNGLIGLPPQHKTRLQMPDKPLAYDAMFSQRPDDGLTQLTKQLRSGRPDLMQAQQAYLVAEKDLQIAVIRQFPGLALGPTYERGEGEESLGGVLSMELPIFNQNQGQIAIATAQRLQSRQAYVALLHQARGELYDAWQRLETFDVELSFYFSDVAPRLQRSLDLTEKAFKAGNLGLFPVILFQRRVLDSKREILESLRDFHRAKIDLAQSVGPIVSQGESSAMDWPGAK